MKFRLRHKISGLALLSALLPVLALLLLLSWQTHGISTLVLNQFEASVKESVTNNVAELYQLLKTYQATLQSRVDADLDVAHYLFNHAGPVTEGPETVAWDAINQTTHEQVRVTLPEFKVGGQWLGQNTDLATATPLVDDVIKLVGGTCTVFQRMNEAGDMLRVATNVETLGGKRALATFIPAVTPAGKPDPVIKAVMAGETFRGPAYVVNAWYQSDYEPIKNAAGRVIGMLYVGSKQESDTALREVMQAQRVGKLGYVWAAYGKNSRNLPPFVLYGGAATPPENLDTVRGVFDGATQTAPVYHSFVNDALATAPGTVQYREAAWRDGKDAASNPDLLEKDIGFTYYEPWDWVIGITAYDADFAQVRDTMEQAFWRVRLETLGGAIVFLIAVGFLATFLGRRVADPISFVTRIAQKVADGDVAAARGLVLAARGGRACSIAAKSTDETGQLFQAIAEMIENLQELLGRVRSSAAQLRRSAGDLGTAAGEQEGVVQDFGASTSQIAAAVREISATAQELAQTMTGVSTVAAETASAANASRRQVEGLKAVGQELTRATGSISSRFTAIAEKARNINAVITAITKVADQTNLLSLNAAIEAEKAGDFGLGFSVVAREIRRLADQTAESTLDIERMVKEMQTAVAAGVMEMDKFSETVRTGGERNAEIAGHLVNIIQQVEDLTPRLGSVKEGMQSQSQGARQISEAVSSLNQAAQRTTTALDGYKTTTHLLNDAVDGLQEGVECFHLENGETGELSPPPPRAPTAAPAPPPAGKPARPPGRTIFPTKPAK